MDVSVVSPKTPICEASSLGFVESVARSLQQNEKQGEYLNNELFGRLLFIRLQAQVGREGMRQHVQCKVGMLSAFWDMVRLLSRLLRSVESFEIHIPVPIVILLCLCVCFYHFNTSYLLA